MIRPVQLTDAAAVAAIYRYYVEETTVSFELVAPDEATMRERIRSVTSARLPYYVWEAGGVVEGFCYAHPWKDRPAYAATLETTVYLSPSIQGKGIGRALMQQLIHDCRAWGAHALIACITAENTHSCHFHEQLGFARVSYFPEVGRKQDRWLDVVDYELLITPVPEKSTVEQDM